MTESMDPRSVLSDREYEKVLNASFRLPPPLGIALRFTAETGCRCGETLLVRKRHLEFRNRRSLSIVQIPTLGKAGHPPLPVHLDNGSAVVAELRQWSKTLRPDDLLFPMARRTFQRAFERILDTIKPDRASLVHLLRRTRASRLVRSGLDPNTILREMRWSSLKLLKVYSHPTDAEVSKAFRKMR